MYAPRPLSGQFFIKTGAMHIGYNYFRVGMKTIANEFREVKRFLNSKQPHKCNYGTNDGP